MLSILHQKIGDYSIIEQIAESYKSVIYKGIHSRTNEYVIIKIIKKNFKSASEIVLLKQDNKILKNLKIKGFLKIQDLIIHESEIIFISDYSNSITLKNYLLKSSLNYIDFLNIAIQISSTLSQLHGENLTHKNLKPQNIYVQTLKNKITDVYMGDFGYSFLLNDSLGELYNPSVIETVLPYISPEQTGRMNVATDYRTDFYSLGIVFYEMLTRKPPFQSLDPLEIIHSHLAKMPTPIHEIDKSMPTILSNIIQKLLSKSPEDRYQSASGLKSELEICLDQIRDTGRIYALNPGELDIIDRFVLPQKLIGRENEIQKILDAFNYISHGKSGVVLVSGVPGIGKSSIIKEVNKPIINARGYFASGKYDQMRKDVPFSSIIQAFQNLFKQILTESENKIQRWRRNILSAVGENGQIVIHVVPELELIIGQQPQVLQLNPEESQNRFNHIFTNLIKVFSKEEHPFVLFLDDVQWADAPSLSLLKAILSDNLLNHFLLILSFRESIISNTHPFSIFIEELKRNKTKIDKIHLKPLQLDNIQIFLETLMGKKKNEIEDLAIEVYNKTRGNPFFLNQFVKNLYDDKVIHFSKSKGWVWEIEKVKQFQVTENVIELMIIKINKLSDSAKKLIIYGSCIGNRFTIDSVSFLAQLSYEETVNAINENITEGLIYLSNNLYRFIHDRVQEAAYSMLPNEEKVKVHVKIGELTMRGLNPIEISEKIFYIVDHLNHGKELLSNKKSIQDLVKLNYDAGKKALSSAAYEPAYHYLKISVSLLEKLDKSENWTSDYSLTLSIYTYCAETSYLCLKYDEMEYFSEIVLLNSKYLLDTIKIYEIKIKTEISKNNYLKSIEYGLEILNKLNINFPKNPKKYHHIFSLLKTLALLSIKGVNFFLNSKLTEDPYTLASIRIISCINSVSYWVKPNLLPLLILKVVRLSLQKGPTIYTSYNLNGLGLILSSIGLFDFGNTIGKIAIKLAEKINNQEQNPRTIFVYNTFIRHWNSPLRDTLKPLADVYQKCLEIGDLEFASHSAVVDVYYSYSAGIEIEDLQKIISKYLDNKKNLRYQSDLNIINLYRQSLENFLGRSKDISRLKGAFYDIDLMLPLHEETKDYATLFHTYLCSLIHSYLSNRFSKSIEFSDKIIKVIEDGISVYGLVVYHFYDSLTKIAILKQGSKENNYRNDIENNLKMLNKWRKHSPSNCDHKFFLIKAEYYSLENKKEQAIIHYELAIREARKSNYLQEEALALELAGSFYLSIDFRDHAKNMLLLSRSTYMRWGAVAMVNKIDNIYANLLRESSSSLPGTIGLTINSSSNLDISTILKSSQALSGEIELGKLLIKILNVSIENAGAQRGILILSKKGKLYIEAETSAIGGEIITSISLDDYKDIPLSIINYVRKTGQSIVLPNAYEKGMFTDDIYIYQKKMKSILCAPIIQKGNMSGILYLENNLSPNIFTRERLELLSILSSQAAISIENALLLAQREISAKLSKEMEITSGIQNSLIPEKSEIQGYDVTGYMKPAESVGGDYYDVINTPKKDWIIIGDVSGHGILSGLIMMMVQTSIHLTLSNNDEITPSELLRIIINGIEDNIRKISKYQYKYMTITIFCHDKNGNFVHAGQHQDLLIFRSENSTIESIPTEGLWIGLGKLNESNKNLIQDKTFQMNKGDTLLLYTDGVTESEEKSEGNMLGVEGLSEILKNSKENSTTEIKDQILEKLESYTTKDDTTFLIIKKLF